MDFSNRLAAIRKERGFTQKGLAKAAGLSQIQVHRYENGNAQPTLEAIKRLAVTLSVTTDELVFDAEERGPSDDLRLQFEAVASFDEEDKAVARTLLDSLILRNQSKRWVHREEAG
ncbi:MAG: XRE family transcriptional regulator [Deltaproteobacteria bacterium]|nr:MAG: XRE family transcriptional regulator [Deltaproteobacteria bacterium]